MRVPNVNSFRWFTTDLTSETRNKLTESVSTVDGIRGALRDIPSQRETIANVVDIIYR